MISSEKVKEMYVLFTNGYTLKEIGLMYELTGERVRQLLYKVYGESAGRKFGGISKKVKPRTKEQGIWYNTTRRNVLAKGQWEWTIEREDIEWTNVCPILGTTLDWDSPKIALNSPSLRRIDRSKGYVPGNVQLCSYGANLKYIWKK